jgi:hypothetical protein
MLRIRFGIRERRGEGGSGDGGWKWGLQNNDTKILK